MISVFERCKYISTSILGLSLLLIGLLPKCASGPPVTTDYDPSEDITTYKSSATIGGFRLGSSYGSGASVRLRALGSCSGSECEPEEIVLVFQASGSSNLRMENRAVELQVDGEKYRSTTGKDENAQSIHQVDQVSGNIASLQLSFAEFQRFATAEKVRGELGSSDFSLGYDNRSSFRAFVQCVKGEASREKASQEDLSAR